MKIDIDAGEDLKSGKTDDRGRFYLGQEMADREDVHIAIVDRGDPKDGDDDGN